ncbi:ABC transporter permease [Chitinophaga flava]|uniref:ABC transporter permease n=1 Tax=Chitinophaga flava TaxID=2259036 RepID=A0A365XUE0_9BACT|nr:ABC transporter permease [Chitinophaga flava]RBL89969.1 ABC transporter permease [Chitinophaga flava]
MLSNYFKIAIAVLKRRKFFTFISLFGISFTLMIIIVLTALLDHVLSPSYPDVNRDRELYITEVKMTSQGSMSQSPLSYYYFRQYISKLKIPVSIALASEPQATNTYVSNKKIVINIKYTNDQFWDVFQYKFTEGKPYTQQQIDNGEKVIVISEDTRRNYFGDDQHVTGKYIETDNVQYRVIGVVKNVPVTLRYNYGDAFLPYTESKSNLSSHAYEGIFIATLLARNKSDLPRIQEEYQQIVSKVQLNGQYDKVQSYADPYLVVFTRQSVAADDDSQDAGVVKTFSGAGALLFLFLLLPTLNLVNINISRISERSSEIGIRKSFGASSKVLILQFIVENIILTVIGGILGVVLAVVVIQIFNYSQFVDNLHLAVNFTVLFYSFLVSLIFGLLSGVYPAWRMSKMNVVTALKAS